MMAGAGYLALGAALLAALGAPGAALAVFLLAWLVATLHVFACWPYWGETLGQISWAALIIAVVALLGG
jgi:hypothetical protein